MSRRRLLTVSLLTSQLLAHFTSGGLVAEMEKLLNLGSHSQANNRVCISSKNNFFVHGSSSRNKVWEHITANTINSVFDHVLNACNCYLWWFGCGVLSSLGTIHKKPCAVISYGSWSISTLLYVLGLLWEKRFQIVGKKEKHLILKEM